MNGGAGILGMLVVVGAAILVWSLNLQYRRRELQHRERMAALDKGAALPPLEHEGSAPWTPRTYLLRGMIWLFSGLALTAALFAITVTATAVRPLTMDERVFRATDARHRGATEDEVKLLLAEPNAASGPSIPVGLALLGLVPAGVGAPSP